VRRCPRSLEGKRRRCQSPPEAGDVGEELVRPLGGGEGLLDDGRELGLGEELFEDGQVRQAAVVPGDGEGHVGARPRSIR
jgi:hypothetical protein